MTEGSEGMIESVNGGRQVDAPMVQLCVDLRTLPDAIEVAQMGLRAGVDWLELGTPLISWVGLNSLAAFGAAFPDGVKFVDAKVMDASAPYVKTAGELGMQMVCLCASASDATFRAALAAGKENGVKVVGDLYAVADPVRRAEELIDLDVDAIYLHYGYDQLNESVSGNQTLEHLTRLRKLTELPLGIVTADTEFAERAVAEGADILLVSHPYLVGDGVEEKLADYVTRVKSAARS
ncbi:MAG TPA: orotidine 5'-phosphate decarboxylase / HUMPS family protein [Solirubrobacterales bacterium]